MRTILVLGSLLAVSACSGGTVEVGGYGAADSGGGALPDGAPDSGGALPDGAPDSGGALPDGAPVGTTAKVAIHVRASTAPISHTDGLSGQTPSDQKIGIRKLTMMTSATDPSPLVVFDHGPAAVEAGLNHDDDTVVATVPATTLKAGDYTIARVTISHVRYRVAATMHAVGQSVPGAFENLQILSDASTVDGETWSKGQYRFSFGVGGKTLATQRGEGSHLPLNPSGGGITMETTESETAYVFPIRVPVEPNVRGDVKLIFEVNTHDNFRWQDEAAQGYASGVFDVTPTSYEPVKSFGANSFRLVAEFSAPPEASNAGADSFTCPPNGTIDCMPVVPPERRQLCSGPYGAWIRKNCPGVTFTY